MNSNTDLILLIVIIIAIFRGWRTGLLRTLVAPGSFLMGALIAVIHYDLNENIITSIFLALMVTVIVSIVVNVSFSLSRRTLNEKQRSYVFIGSRMAGLITNVTWQGMVFSLIIILLSIMPGTVIGIEDVQRDIKKSFSYFYVQVYVLDQIPVLQNVTYTVEVLSDPIEIKYIEDTDEYRRFAEDERIQDVLLDEETMQQIHNKDVLKLIDNPKIKAIFEDEDLMLKFSRLSKKVYEERSRIQAEQAADQYTTE